MWQITRGQSQQRDVGRWIVSNDVGVHTISFVQLSRQLAATSDDMAVRHREAVWRDDKP
jgi:hypothetical protein